MKTFLYETNNQLINVKWHRNQLWNRTLKVHLFTTCSQPVTQGSWLIGVRYILLSNLPVITDLGWVNWTRRDLLTMIATMLWPVATIKRKYSTSDRNVQVMSQLRVFFSDSILKHWIYLAFLVLYIILGIFLNLKGKIMSLKSTQRKFASKKLFSNLQFFELSCWVETALSRRLDLIAESGRFVTSLRRLFISLKTGGVVGKAKLSYGSCSTGLKVRRHSTGSVSVTLSNVDLMWLSRMS